IYPPIPRDNTASNWKRKAAIFARSRVYVCCACRWLARKVDQSMLRSAVVETRLIPYGVDLKTFRPADKAAVRQSLGIPAGEWVLLFAANSIRNNMWKDYRTLQAAVGRLAEARSAERIRFVALGESGPPEQIGRATIQFVPFQNDPAAVALYYQAA